MSSEAPTTVRWGIMSTAAIAKKVVAAMHSADGNEVVAVASRDLAKAEAWAKEFDVPKAYGSYDELLADADIDVVYCPLPTAFKKEWALKIAKAGKSMVLEKPLPGDTPADMEEIVKACADNGVQFFDGSMWQHSTRTKVMKERVAGMGAVRRIESGFSFNPMDEEWLNGGNGRTDKTREPWGCFGDQGWYPCSAIMFFANYDLPSRVQAVSVTKNKVDTVVAGGAVIWWADGRWATFDFGATAAHRSYVHVACEKGALNLDDLVGGQGKTGDFSAYERQFTGSTYFRVDDVTGKEERVEVEPCNHTELMIVDMGECVRAIRAGGEPAKRWPDAALANHRLMCALWESIEAGCVAVDL